MALTTTISTPISLAEYEKSTGSTPNQATAEAPNTRSDLPPASNALAAETIRKSRLGR